MTDDSMASGVHDDWADSADDSIDTVDENADDEVIVDSEIDAPVPATWKRPETTGVAGVDLAIEELTRLDELPTSEHVAVYEDLHGRLQDALADLDGS